MPPDDRVAEIRQRLEAATPGPWMATGRTFGRSLVGRLGHVDKPRDAEFIAAAPADVAWLLSRLAVVEAERDELRAKVEAVKELITEGAGMAHRCFAAVRHFDERDLRRALSGTTEGPS